MKQDTLNAYRRGLDSGTLTSASANVVRELLDEIDRLRKLLGRTFHADGAETPKTKLGIGECNPAEAIHMAGQCEIILPESSGWKCYLFGSSPGGNGILWEPNEGCVPNFMVRWFMRICLGCTWVKPEVSDE
jgi:hypothetical protein